MAPASYSPEVPRAASSGPPCSWLESGVSNLAGANRQWLFLYRLWWAGPGRKGYEVTSNHVTCSKTQSPAPKTIASGKRDNKRPSSETDADTSDSCLLRFLRECRFWMEPESPTMLERVSRCHCHVHRLVSNRVPLNFLMQRELWRAGGPARAVTRKRVMWG
jgi:hypothetical protein